MNLQEDNSIKIKSENNNNHERVIDEDVSPKEIKKEFFCNVSEVFSPDNFYVQVQGKEEGLNQLLTEINEYYNSVDDLQQMLLPVSKCHVDSFVAAVWVDDGYWYRAKIISIESPSLVQLLFFDFGTKALVYKEKLYSLHHQFSIDTRPALAYLAKLAGIGPASRKWSTACSNRFQSLVGGGLIGTEDVHLKAIVVDGQDKHNKVLLNLFSYTNGVEENIADVLVNEGFARYIVNEKAPKSLPKNFEKCPGLLQQLNSIVKVPDTITPSQQRYLEKIKTELHDLEQEFKGLRQENVTSFASKQMKLVKKVVGMSMDFLITHPDTKKLMTPAPKLVDTVQNDSPKEDEQMGNSEDFKCQSLIKEASKDNSNRTIEIINPKLTFTPKSRKASSIDSSKKMPYSATSECSVVRTVSKPVDDPAAEDKLPSTSNIKTREVVVDVQSKISNETRALYFSIQRGGQRSEFKVTVNEMQMKLSKFGKVCKVNVSKRKKFGLDGCIVFEDNIDKDLVKNELIAVAKFEILILLHWKDISEEQTSSMVLLECKKQGRSPFIGYTEIRKLFGGSGKVKAVMCLGHDGLYSQEEVVKFVVSFYDSCSAQRLLGMSLKLRSYIIDVKEVSYDSVKYNKPKVKSNEVKESDASEVNVFCPISKLSRSQNDESHDSRVFFSIQEGGRPKQKHAIVEAFSKFGAVDNVVIYTRTIRGVDGFVRFRLPFKKSVENSINKTIQIGQTKLLTLSCWNFERVSLNQVLVEYPILRINMKALLESIFNQYGDVNGIIHLPKDFSGPNRFVISFNESASAQDLVGTTIGSNPKVLVEKASQETIFRREYFVARSSRCVWFSRQDGENIELKRSYILEAFSNFGIITKVIIFEGSKRGIDGFVEFLSPNRVSNMINKVVKAGQCLLYCLNHWALLDEVPIPHQILVTMEGTIGNRANVLQKYFSQHGTVTGIISLGLALTTDRFLYKTSYIIGFRERETVQKMVGSNVEIMRCSGYIKEVTKETFYSSFVPSPHHIL